jgi:uncharacterized damage-inducible protein DinB
MNKEVQSIIKNLENVLNGQPWYGKPVYALLGEVSTTVVDKKPTDKSHSLLELLYHMNTWAEFTLKSVQGAQESEIKNVTEKDWRDMSSPQLGWEKGLKEFKSIHEELLKILPTKDDQFLDEMVKLRKFNYGFLLNGLIQHNIYHVGQIAYLQKLLG